MLCSLLSSLSLLDVCVQRPNADLPCDAVCAFVRPWGDKQPELDQIPAQWLSDLWVQPLHTLIGLLPVYPRVGSLHSVTIIWPHLACFISAECLFLLSITPSFLPIFYSFSLIIQPRLKLNTHSWKARS